MKYQNSILEMKKTKIYINLVLTKSLKLAIINGSVTTKEKLWIEKHRNRRVNTWIRGKEKVLVSQIHKA